MGRESYTYMGTENQTWGGSHMYGNRVSDIGRGSFLREQSFRHGEGVICMGKSIIHGEGVIVKGTKSPLREPKC